MIVTQYAGSDTVNVYASTDADSANVVGTLLSDGRIQTAGVGADDANADMFITLKPAGMYYFGLDAGMLAGDGSETVAEMAEAVQVFSVSGNNASGAEVSGYAVFKSKTDTTSGTTVIYADADITVAIDHDGDGETAVEEVAVTAKIPEATDYKHIHFGVWAALGEAEKDGTQKIADLGIGFVQSIGDGLTGADMPNNGSGNYSGNWVAAVQARDEDGNGPIVLTNGVATLNADFGMGEITATLVGLAKLDGTIDTNTFSGTKATVTSDSLDSDGKFTGSFSGGFYGTKAAEAGGVFDFASDDDDGANEGGAFRGAFGADRK